MKRKSTISVDDFVAYLPMHNYIFLPTREPWPASSVDSQLPFVAMLDEKGSPVLDKKGKPLKIPAHLWLDINRPVQQMTWSPGLPMLIRGQLVAEGGWFSRTDATCLNLYRPPVVESGNARKAKPWLEHVLRIYPADASHIVKWLAHRVQRPGDKVNHALLLGGAQGIGKDTLLAPVKHAVGAWNFIEVSPAHMFGRFNGYVKSVILRVNEGRDLGDSNRFDFYERMKPYTAAPPEVLRCDEKNLREHNVINVCGTIITSNYKTEGIYLPSDDRRHFVAWSDRTKEDFTPAYWKKLWKWYASGGNQHVAAYLGKLDISAFDAKAPPPKTPAFWSIVDANRAPEEGELVDIFEKLGNPDAVTLAEVIHCAELKFSEWLEDRKNRRIIPHRFKSAGYVPVRNSDSDQGLWRINGVRQVIYVKATLSIREQLQAVQVLQRKSAKKAAEAAKNKANSYPLRVVRF